MANWSHHSILTPKVWEITGEQEKGYGICEELGKWT